MNPIDQSGRAWPPAGRHRPGRVDDSSLGPLPALAAASRGSGADGERPPRPTSPGEHAQGVSPAVESAVARHGTIVACRCNDRTSGPMGGDAMWAVRLTGATRSGIQWSLPASLWV